MWLMLNATTKQVITSKIHNKFFLEPFFLPHFNNKRCENVSFFYIFTFAATHLC